MSKKVLVIIIIVAILALVPAILLGLGILGTSMVIQNQADNVVDNASDNMSIMAVIAKNTMVEKYNGDVNARLANDCLMMVKKANMQGTKIVELENDEIENNKQYNISFEYDKEGYINKVIIKEID